MLLDTAKFGRIEMDEKDALRFVGPILGFAELQDFALLEPPATAPIRWLQSTESLEVAFPVIDPFLLAPDYDVAVSPRLLEELQAAALDDLSVLTIVVVAKRAEDIRANLRAPVIYSPAARLAKQIVLEDTDYPVQYFFARQQGAGCGSESVHVGA